MRSGLERSSDALVLVVSRYHEHWNRLGVLVRLQVSTDLDAVHPGHHDVQENRVGRVLDRPLQTGHTIPSRDDLKALSGKKHSQQGQVFLAVVDDEKLRQGQKIPKRAVARTLRTNRSRIAPHMAFENPCGHES